MRSGETNQASFFVHRFFCDDDGNTWLHHAVMNNDYLKIDRFGGENPELPNAVSSCINIYNRFGNTPLMLCKEGVGETVMIEILLSFQPNVFLVTYDEHGKPKTVAIEFSKRKSVNFLRKLCDYVNAFQYQDQAISIPDLLNMAVTLDAAGNQETPLVAAATMGHYQHVSFMLASGASAGKEVFHQGAMKTAEEMVQEKLTDLQQSEENFQMQKNLQKVLGVFAEHRQQQCAPHTVQPSL